MLHKTQIKCCVKAYTAYSDIEYLFFHPSVVQKSNMLFKNYTTYKNIFHYMWQNMAQEIKKYYTTYEKHLNSIWHLLLNIWLQIRQHMTKH